VGQRTAVTNQIRGFLIERGITVRQGLIPLRKALPEILSSNSGALSPRMLALIAGLAADWRRLDERIATVSTDIESLAEQDGSCQRLMTVPGIGPIIASAVVAAIGNGAGFQQGRDFGPRAGAKGNADQQSTHRTQSRTRVTQALSRVRQAASPSDTQGRSRMLESGPSGSARGVPSNGHPYRDPGST
jgi:transposase